MRNFIKKYFGFTMAETAILIIILSIIATIMLTTMKPAKYKEKSLEILARQTLTDLDETLTLVIINDCPGRNLDKCNNPYGDGTFSMGESTHNPVTGRKLEADALGILMRKYMSVSREPAKEFYTGQYPNPKIRPDVFKLKNGVEVDVDRVFSKKYMTWIPGEKQGIEIDFPSLPKHYGCICVDINGAGKGPNVLGKDKFRIPLDKNGIVNRK